MDHAFHEVLAHGEKIKMQEFRNGYLWKNMSWLVVEPHLKKYESRNGFIFPKINNIGKHHFPVSIQHPSQPGPVKPGFPPGSLECLWSAQWIGRKTLVTGDGEAPKVTSYPRQVKPLTNFATGPGWTFSISSFLQCGHIAITCHNYLHKTSKVEGLKAEDDETSKVEYVEWYPMVLSHGIPVSPSSFGYRLGQWLQLPGFNTAGITDMIDSHAWKDCR